MSRFLYSKLIFRATAVALVFIAVAATPPKEKPVVAVVRLADIDRESVRVRTSSGDPSAQLSFLFRDKDAEQVRRLYFATKSHLVRIKDGPVIITETKLAGIVEGETKAKQQSGLILSFNTVEEANRVAATLRPFLK